MSMNIGPMMKALLGDGQPVDSRSLELRIGQIVRGVLMELLEGQDALINIGGVQVRAKLDAEMALGKSTLLQVQSTGAGGLVTLKPLADLSDAIPDSGFKEIMKNFGLPDHKSSMELLRGLKRDGYSIGRETASFFNSAMALKPPGADAASWSSAADVAFRRGLPPTETTLTSLRQALFGQPINDELTGMRSAVADWLGSGKSLSPEANALGQKLQALLNQGASLLAEGGAQLSGEAAGNGITQTQAQGNGQAAGQTAAPTQGNASAQSTANAQVQGQANAQGQAQAADDGTQLTREMNAAAGKAASEAVKPEGAAARSGAAPAAASAPAQSAAAQPAAGQDAAARASGQSAPPPSAAGAASAAGTAAAAADGLRAPTAKTADAQLQPSAPKAEAPWIGRFLQWLGVGHEHALMHGADARLPGDNAAGLPAGAAFTAGADAPAQEVRQHAADTLKSALLALSMNDEVPPALREAAQSLANQVTGQQLLLSTERNTTAPFSHMTLFVPMKGSDGDTTATVHVQTRRSRRGEWDVDNCHLLFDLRMRNLGDTLVDVSVVDRIVSVKLLSDFPGMSELLNTAREELAAGMSTAGFQLLSLSAAPLPQWKGGAAAAALPSALLDKTTSAGDYATKPYKGVDYRA